MAILLLATALSTALPALAPLAQSRLVREVQYHGADHLSTKELGRLAGIHPGERMAPQRNELGRQAVLRHYHEEGRLFASVELVEGGSPFDTRVIYRVIEGPAVRVAGVQFRGNNKVNATDLLAAKRKNGATVGAKFRPSLMAEDVRTLGNYYQQLGLTGTKIRPEVVRTAEMNRIVIVYHVAEAQK